MAGVPADPWSAGFNALGAVAGAAKAPPAGPSNAVNGGFSGGSIDSSGWNVTFGPNSGITSDRDQTAAAGVPGALASVTKYMPQLALVVVAVVVLKKLRKKS